MNVVYVDVDSLRADHVGAYGYGRETTPNIDELATDGVWFENAYAANTPCLPSRAALLSGRYGINNGVETHGPMGQVLNSPKHWKPWYATWSEDWQKSGRKWLAETTGESREWLTLPELFFHNRVRTGAVSSFPRHTAPWFYHLWHEYLHPQEPDASGEYMQTVRSETVIDTGIEFLERNGDEDFFLYVQLWDPHAPYKRTEDEIEQFRGEELPPHPTAEQIDSHREWDAWRSATQLSVSDRNDLDELLANYDAEIRYADEQIGRLFEYLRDEGLYEETTVVVTADHGEEFGEHGLYREHWSTHDGTQRVPMIIKPTAGTRIETGRRDQLVTNVDVAPTLASYAGFDSPGQWQGRSMRPFVENSDADGPEHVVFDHGVYTAQRAVRARRWKFIRTYHPGLWGGVVPDRQLFDVESDPWEQENVAAENPSVVDRLESALAQWAEAHVGREEDALHAVVREGPAGYNGQKDNWSGV